jgi:hypothetical protein
MSKGNHWTGDSWSRVEVTKIYDGRQWLEAGCPLNYLDPFLVGYIVVRGETVGPFDTGESIDA